MGVSSTASGQPKYGLRNAFDALRIPSSPGTNHMPYDVFISHCRQDVQQTLANSIYNYLDGLGLQVFLDNNRLNFWDSMPRELEEAMASASIHIAIFSQYYAQSPQCLAELTFMIKTRTTIIPIFYHVEPSYLRWLVIGKGTYADGFSGHGKADRYTPEDLHEWKRALQEVSYFTGGIIIKNVDDEQRVVKNLVNRVVKETNKVPTEVAKHLVGLYEAMRYFDTIALKTAGTIQIVGIRGMGGSGKTTLAKEIYKKRSSMIDRSSFIYNIGDATEKGLLVDKQKKLLDDLDVKGVSFDDVDVGRGILNSHLRSISVLIILDDVDNTDQLDALLPAKESLGEGSLIVVTTRRLDVLKARGISNICQMRALNATHSRQLFCWHAFLQPFPRLEFEALVEKFLKVCNGLPLQLKVLGGKLYGESCKDNWQRTLKELSILSDRGIRGQLKVSYDALDEKEKEMFSDIACFFIGEETSLAIEVWEGSDWDGQIGLERLLSKCLVEVDDNNVIQMHDHLRDLGRQIARRQSPYRLWSPQQFPSIPPQESLQIRGMTNTISDPCHLWKEKIIQHTSFEKQTQTSFSLALCSLGLKLLVCSRQFLNQEVGELSRELLWLRWNDFNHTNLPSWLSLKNLRVLELNGALNLQELWTDAEHLRELIITGTWSACFEMFPSSISNLKYLKKIALLGCVCKEFSIRELPEEFCGLQSLEHLELRHCNKLSTLPTHFGELRKLRHLDLYSCQMLRKFPISFKQLVDLEYLDLSGCKKLPSMPDILENMRKLKKLYFTGCPKFQELPLQIAEQKYLRVLHLKKTMLKDLPTNIGQLSKLETLVIGSPHLTGFPESLGYLSSLVHLKITGCINLKYFPESVEHLKLLGYLCIKSSGVRSLPQGFRQLTNLQILKIFDCPIAELDVGSASCTSLRKLQMIHLKATDVTRLSISQNCCPNLQTLQIELNRRLVEIDVLSTSVKMVKVYECPMLRNINGISGLVKLESMEITGCPKLGQDNIRAAARSTISTH
ncbi:disease resistance protein RPV1 isoform X2 [Cryptomeria japonica]|uniref:disease resistance protein RPV1 isoform X2 n=1 Tax=Cryptomeria japonica TaxID=3369 RepID=UPI0027DA153E|nr:disease resistance protein RPV1 isoform X2 [Cryptomeria japonica]